MKQIKTVLSVGYSPGYLKKIGINFFVIAAIMAFLMVAGITKITSSKTIITIVLFVFGLLSFMAAHLKMKHCKKHWQEIGEPEITPRELRRSAKHFAQLGLMIVAFIVSKSLVLEIFPDWYDITAIFVPFSICVYLVAKSRGRR